MKTLLSFFVLMTAFFVGQLLGENDAKLSVEAVKEGVEKTAYTTGYATMHSAQMLSHMGASFANGINGYTKPAQQGH